MDDEYVDENIVEEDHDNDNEYENYDDTMQFQQQEQQEEIFIQPENDVRTITTPSIWLKAETEFLLQRYNKYIKMVSKFGTKFRTKKEMWQRIANELKAELNVHRTSEQVENRFKTITKRRSATSKNLINAAKIMTPHFEMVVTNDNVQFKTEAEVDRNDDDPVDYDRDISNKATLPRIKNTLNGSTLLRDTLLEINKIQEENKERRHREMMELWRELLTNRFN